MRMWKACSLSTFTVMQESSRCGDSQHASHTSFAISMDSQPHLQHHYHRQPVSEHSGCLQSILYSLLLILTSFCEHCMHMWPCVSARTTSAQTLRLVTSGTSHSVLRTPSLCEHCMHMWQLPCCLVALAHLCTCKGRNSNGDGQYGPQSSSPSSMDSVL